MKKILAILCLLTLVLAACQPIIKEGTTEEKVLDDNQVTETTDTQDSQDSSTADEVVVVEDGVSIEDNYDSSTETQDSQTDSQEETEELTTKEDEYLGLTGEVFVVESVEGKLVTLNPKAEDPDGDAIIYGFSEPFDKDGKWQTQIGDAGKYRVTVTASDGKTEVSEDILVIIQRANRAPEVVCNKDVVVNEGDLIELQCEISDIDEDALIVGYSGFMTTNTYQTTFEDAGEYTVQVSAADATHKTTEDISITVLDVNRAPIVNPDFVSTISVKETTPIKIDTSKIVDPDEDELSFSFSEPFDENGEWTPKEGDAGIYYVEAVISDGHETITKQINVEVKVKNRPPVFTFVG